jgi:hypothetical protein
VRFSYFLTSDHTFSYAVEGNLLALIREKLNSIQRISLLVSCINYVNFWLLMLLRWTVAETVQVPTMAESITEGTLKTWTKKVGDTVAQDEEVATIETDKVSISASPSQQF